MPKPLTPVSISATEFLQTLSQYKAFTSYPSRAASRPQSTAARAAKGRQSDDSKSLQSLDLWRINTLPATVAARTQAGQAYLSSDELEDLLKCKMKRGKFRPQLLPQLASNIPSAVVKVTAEAFEYNKNLKPGEKPDLGNLKSALNHLAKNLKGVGPATASYLLSAQIPQWVPPFSDEGFRWVFIDKQVPGVTDGKASLTDGWRKPIKYTLKEYLAYIEEVWSIRERLLADYTESLEKGEEEEEELHGKCKREQFSAESVEMVGWVLGKQAEGWEPEPEPEQGLSGESVQGIRKAQKGSKGKRKYEDGPKAQENMDNMALEDAQDEGGVNSKTPREPGAGKAIEAPTSKRKATRKVKAGGLGDTPTQVRRSSRTRKAPT